VRDFFKPADGPFWLTRVLASIRSALGDEWFAPLKVKQFATSELPNAASYVGAIVYDETEQQFKFSNGTAWVSFLSSSGSTGYESHLIDIGDETTALTTGIKKTFRMPYAFELEHPEGTPLIGVRASLTTASSSGAVTIDVLKGGVSIFSTTLTIDESETTSVDAATAGVIATSTLADDDEMDIEILGAGTNAAGLKVWLIGARIGGDSFGILMEGDESDTPSDVEALEGDMTDGDDTLLQEGA